MGKEIKYNSCPEIPFFGASYPDGVCIDGRMWDLDSGDQEHGLSKGGEYPCPFCNWECSIADAIDNEEGTYEELIIERDKLWAKHGYTPHN